MSFFGSKLFGLSGSSNSAGTGNNSNGSSISGAETIERLCDRVQQASLIEDRRDSLSTIKSLSKKYKLEVGTQAMPILIEVLDKSRMDSELCCLALDTLYNIMTTDPNNEQEQKNLPADITTQFTEMFIKSNNNTHLLFDLLDEYEFQTRWCTIKLLNALIQNQTQQLQEIILQIPRGVSRLMDLLSDSREVIRNDTILLLNNLTKTNANIQKIIAFESGFDKIMEIIESEGSAIDGGIVVEDCFNLLLNLLQMNYSNQNFFKEANYIKMLCKYLDLNGSNANSNLTVPTSNSVGLANDLGDPNNSGAWTVQKTTNINLLLKLIRCLVASGNQQSIINDCQKAFNHFGLLHRLCAMLMLPGVPSDLLSQAINTVGEVIRGNTTNQQLFSAVMMQTNPPKQLIVILLMSMINEKQPFHLRCSILYCFECFLYKNEKAKAEIVDTLLPKEQQQQNQAQSQITTGQILCIGLFNHNDVISNWLCAVAISHTINENNQLKEQLLRVQLAVNTNEQTKQTAPISLMQQCMTILIESTSSNAASNSMQSSSLTIQNSNRCKFQTTVSILMLMSTWLSNCPTAVNYFLSQQQNIPYLISQVSSTDTEDKSLIIQGLSAFLLGLSMLYNTDQIETYTIEKLRDIIKKRVGIEQFEGKLEFISQHEFYTKTLKMPTFAFKSKQSADLLFDYEFTRLYKSNETLILNLLNNKNQNIAGSVAISSGGLNNGLSRKNSNEQSRFRSPNELEQHSSIIGQFQQIIRDQDIKLKEQHQLYHILSQNYQQLQEHCQNLTASYNSIQQSTHSESFSSDKLNMQAKINELQVKLNLLEEKCSEQEDDICKLQREKGILQETINNLHTAESNVEVIELKNQNKQLKKDFSELNKEQENLLTLLQDMELKLNDYKQLLKNYGYNQLSDSDDEDDEDEGFEHVNLNEHNPKQNNQMPISNEPITLNTEVNEAENNFNFKFSNQLNLNEMSNLNKPNTILDNNEYSNEEHYIPNRINLIIEENHMSKSNSNYSLSPNRSNETTNVSSDGSSSENSFNKQSISATVETSSSTKPSFNQPPPVGQILNTLVDSNFHSSNSNSNNAINPFFQQHPFFSQQLQQQQPNYTEQNKPQLQNYFK